MTLSPAATVPQRRWIGDAVAILFFAAILARYFQHGTQVLDVEFSDETVYLSAGTFRDIVWSRHEFSGLYSFYYRALSGFLNDPVDLFLTGGLILLGVCAAAVFVSLRLFSRSPVFALLGSGLYLFSGALAVTPRVSHLAIVLLAAGLAVATRVRSLLAKLSVLLLTAFLVAFVRPEYVLAFNLVAIALVVWVVREAIHLMRHRGAGRPGAASVAIAGVSLVAVGLLAHAWELPTLRSNERAFVAFGQHYAVRYVQDHKLATNPYLNFVEIVGDDFPGAKSVGQAIAIAPAKYMGFLAGNTVDFFAASAAFLKRAVSSKLAGRAGGAAGLLLIVAGVVLAGWRIVADRRAAPPSMAEERRCYRLNMACVAVLVLPPLIACILVFPRDHYLVVSFYLILAGFAFTVRTLALSASPPFATALVGAGLLLATPVLPESPQVNLHDIQALRKISGIASLYEMDGGWCYYYRPRCKTVSPSLATAEPLSEALSGLDAIMLSPGLYAFDQLTRQPIFQELVKSPERFGFERIQISPHRVLLYRRQPAR